MRNPGGEGSLVIGRVTDMALTTGDRGKYNATVTQVIRGEYELAVLLDRDSAKALSASDGSKPVPNPLFSGVPPKYYLYVVINPGAKLASECYATTASGLALNLAILTVGSNLRLRIEERDQYGNLRDTITYDEFAGRAGYFDIKFVPVDPLYAHRAYSVPYPEPGSGPPPASLEPGSEAMKYALEPDSPLHEVVTYVGGNGTEIAVDSFEPLYLAGKWYIHITDAGQHIKSSPVLVSFDAAAFSVDNTVVYGPGVNFNNSNPGTVRSDVPTEVIRICISATTLFA
jgi:hypothetical protein